MKQKISQSARDEHLINKQFRPWKSQLIKSTNFTFAGEGN